MFYHSAAFRLHDQMYYVSYESLTDLPRIQVRIKLDTKLELNITNDQFIKRFTVRKWDLLVFIVSGLCNL